jgi:hypothetical protein
VNAQLFLTILLWLIIGSATAYYAGKRGRDPLLWFLVGMMLGLLGLLLLFILPVIASEASNTPKNPTENEELLNAPVVELPNNILTTDWYYYDSRQERKGPVRYELLKTLWQSGGLNEDSFVWCEGMEDWKKIEQMQSLHAYLILQEESNP